MGRGYSATWRLHRVTRYETESTALYQEKAEDDLADRRRFGSRVLGADHSETVRDNLKAAKQNTGSLSVCRSSKPTSISRDPMRALSCAR